MKTKAYIMDCSCCSYEGESVSTRKPRCCPKCGEEGLRLTPTTAFQFLCGECHSPNSLVDSIEAKSGQIEIPHCMDCGAQQ